MADAGSGARRPAIETTSQSSQDLLAGDGVALRKTNEALLPNIPAAPNCPNLPFIAFGSIFPPSFSASISDKEI